MAHIEEIEFTIPETNGPLVRVKGALAQHILRSSDLVKELLEMNNTSKKTLVVPIGDFPTDRKSLFIKILRGVPVGSRESDTEVILYPLGPEEEKAIRAVVNAKALSKDTEDYAIQEERLHAIMDTMRYLMMSDEDIQAMLTFEEKKHNNVSATEDDIIEDLVDKHKYWLYLTRQGKKLTQANKKTIEGELQRIRKSMSFNNNYHPDEDRLHPNSYEPYDVEQTGDMWPIEYERWLRTEYFKPQRARLNMGPRLNLVFKNNGNGRSRKTRRARKNRRNTRRERK